MRKQTIEREQGYKAGRVHTYPSKYKPGTHWATDRAWEILDFIKPGTLEETVRNFLAGYIAGALMQTFEAGKEGRLPYITKEERS